MRYKRISGTDISELGLLCSAAARLERREFTALVDEALSLGVTSLVAVGPEEASAVGEALDSLGSRRKAAVSSGVCDFFAAVSRHRMGIDAFLRHELDDRLDRLRTDYLDCFLLDVGNGRAVDLEAVLKEQIRTGEDSKAAAYEGGVFLHETIGDCLASLDTLKRRGRLRLTALAGENVDVLKRILVKNPGFDVVMAPYSYGFRAAADELAAVAAETRATLIAMRPLWWTLRGIPVTVLAESPFPPQYAAGVDAAALASAAVRWPIAQGGAAGVAFEADSPDALGAAARALAAEHWTKGEEETLSAAAVKARFQEGILLILSAMNSPDPDMRERGWAACVRRGLPESGYDPHASESDRAMALSTLASAVVRETADIKPEDLDELL